MVEQLEPITPFAVKADVAAEADADLSAEIAGHVEREPSDRVSCRRIYGNHYRCNWWAPSVAAGYDNPQMYGLTVTTHRVRKSAFLRVTRTRSGLSIHTV